MSLEVRAQARLGDFTLDADVATNARRVCLFGRSGAGKTTLANVVAGLVRPDAGRVAIEGEVLFDSAAGMDAPAWRRRIGYVFQEPRLFPHLNVRANLLYARCWAFRAWWIACPAPCPAGRRGGSPSAAPCCRGRGWSYWTSP